MKAASRRKILDAALELFAHHGYHATSVDKIARKAGVSKGGIYLHFSSKEDLLKGLIYDSMEPTQEAMPDLEQEPKALLRDIIQMTFSELSSKREHYRLLHGLTFQVGSTEFVNTIATEKYVHYIQLFERIFRDMGYDSPHNEAIELGAVFDGIAIQYLIFERDDMLSEMKEHLFKKYDL
jgi:AcrR family transcriptional regulator